MTFNEWFQQEMGHRPKPRSERVGRLAWDYQQARIEELEKALIEIAEAGCEFSYLSGDADTCETPEAGQPRGDWCSPCIANATLDKQESE